MTAQPDAHTRTAVDRWRHALMVIFALPGFATAAWASRTPAIKHALSASTGQMTAMVFAFCIGSMTGILLAAKLSGRLGVRTTIATALAAAGLGLTTLGLAVDIAGGLPAALVGLCLFGIGVGVCNVSMNVSGAANERAAGHTVLPRFHACYSVGLVLGSVIGAVSQIAGLPLLATLTVAGTLIAVAGSIAVRFVPDRTGPAESNEPARAKRRRGDWLDLRTALIAMVALGMTFAEGSANDWLSLAMVDGRHVAGAIGALLFGVFASCMTIGRIAGTRFIDRFGRVAMLRTSALLIVIGLLVVITLPSVWADTLGIALWGFGAALGFPISISAASDDPVRAAVRVSLLASAGYVAFLTGPLLIGVVAGYTGLMKALLVVVALVSCAGLLAPAAAGPRREATPPAPTVA